jgi:hypothetical protein
MALPDITASQGQTRDVALTVDPVSGMQSFTAVISWNGDHLQYAGFTKGALVSGWDVVSQLEGTTLTVAGSSSTSISGSGELVLLEFGVVADGDVSSVIDLVSAKINEGYIETALVDGSFSTAAGFSSLRTGAILGCVQYCPLQPRLPWITHSRKLVMRDQGSSNFRRPRRHPHAEY